MAAPTPPSRRTPNVDSMAETAGLSFRSAAAPSRTRRSTESRPRPARTPPTPPSIRAGSPATDEFMGPGWAHFGPMNGGNRGGLCTKKKGHRCDLGKRWWPGPGSNRRPSAFQMERTTPQQYPRWSRRCYEPHSDELEQPVRAVGPILAPCALPQLETRLCAAESGFRWVDQSAMPVDDAPCGDGRRDHDAMIDRHDRGPQATRAPRTPAGARLGHPASATSAAPTASGVRAVDRAASPRRQAEPCPVTRAKGSPSTCGPTSAGGRRSEGLSGQLLRGR